MRAVLCVVGDRAKVALRGLARVVCLHDNHRPRSLGATCAARDRRTTCPAGPAGFMCPHWHDTACVVYRHHRAHIHTHLPSGMSVSILNPRCSSPTWNTTDVSPRYTVRWTDGRPPPDHASQSIQVLLDALPGMEWCSGTAGVSACGTSVIRSATSCRKASSIDSESRRAASSGSSGTEGLGRMGSTLIPADEREWAHAHVAEVGGARRQHQRMHRHTHRERPPRAHQQTAVPAAHLRQHASLCGHAHPYTHTLATVRVAQLAVRCCRASPTSQA